MGVFFFGLLFFSLFISSNLLPIPLQVVQFCFPDANDFPRSQLRVFFSSSSSSKEVFSFVLTETDGSRRFGFCQRVLLPSRFPRCFCVISSQPAFDVFSRFILSPLFSLPLLSPPSLSPSLLSLPSSLPLFS